MTPTPAQALQLFDRMRALGYDVYVYSHPFVSGWACEVQTRGAAKPDGPMMAGNTIPEAAAKLWREIQSTLTKGEGP